MSCRLLTRGIVLASEQYQQIGSPPRVSILLLKRSLIVTPGDRYRVIEEYGYRVVLRSRYLSQILQLGEYDSHTAFQAGRWTIQTHDCLENYYDQFITLSNALSQLARTGRPRKNG